MKKVLLKAGTRPEIIKLAQLRVESKDSSNSNLQCELCLTGRYASLAEDALRILQLKVDHNSAS